MMTLEYFVKKYPRLYRAAEVSARAGILRYGLLPAAEAARRAGVKLPDGPRKAQLPIELPDGTQVNLTDNIPLNYKNLQSCLDDDLSPEEWVTMLNERVFFWPFRELGEANFQQRLNLGYESEWQVYDSRALLEPVWDRAEIAPINTGYAKRKPARRGKSTFARLKDLDFEDWRRARGMAQLDKIKEVTVAGSIPHAGKALIDISTI